MVVAAVGFVSDHMEVVHDLDVEAAQTAASLGLPFARAKAPGSTPRFAAMVCELVAERTEGEPALALGDLGLGAFAGGAHFCPADCCRYAAVPAAGASDGYDRMRRAPHARAVSAELRDSRSGRPSRRGSCSPRRRAGSRSRPPSPARPTWSPRWTAGRRS